jgi:hypothetical protein
MKIVGDRTARSQKVRELLETEPLNCSRPPIWLRAAVKQAISDGRLPKNKCPINSARAAFDHATKALGHSWADHVGSLKDSDGIELLVSEPYAERINGDSLAQLDRFCRALDTSYLISANSEWYPGRTLRIIVTKNRT